MFTQLIGALAAMAVGILPIFVFSGNPAMFLSAKAMIMVLGGTFAVFMLSNPKRYIKITFRSFGTLFTTPLDRNDILAKEIASFLAGTRGHAALIKLNYAKVKDPFFRSSLSLIAEGIPPDQIAKILHNQIRNDHHHYELSSQVLQTLSKYPPALGLLATVLAMVGILEQMGSGAMGVAGLGPSMGAGLVATFYGILLSNLVLSPLGENLAARGALDLRKKQLIAAIVNAVASHQSMLVVEEILNTLLEKNDQVRFLSEGSADSGADAVNESVASQKRTEESVPNENPESKRKSA
jgi:chemotaxis protein MotA